MSSEPQNHETSTGVGWYILGQDQELIGPYTISELQEHHSSGYLHESTLVWAEGCTEWQPMSSVLGLSTDSQQNAPSSVPVTSNEEDEFEKWQREVREAEAQAEAEVEANLTDDLERPTTPPEGEEEFTDDDGTTYKWDRTLKAWVPQEETAQKKEDYGLEDMVFVQEEEVFPIVDASDLPMKKEEEAVVIPVVDKKNGKRKVREESADKKDGKREVPEESADKKDTEKEKKMGTRRGTIIDSGANLAFLPSDVYHQLFDKMMLQHPDLKTRTERGFECFLYNGSVDDGFPIVNFHFEDSLVLPVHPHRYLFKYRGDEYCIGWQNSNSLPIDEREITLLGDIVLFDKLVVYDLEKQSIGWIEYNCSSSIRVRDETSGNVYGVGSHDISGALALSVLQWKWSFIRMMGLFLAATSVVLV